MDELQNWSKTIPTTPGWYWFYGWYGQYTPENRPIDFFPIMVAEVENEICYFFGIQFTYNFRGFWQRLGTPDIEELTNEKEDIK